MQFESTPKQESAWYAAQDEVITNLQDYTSLIGRIMMSRKRLADLTIEKAQAEGDIRGEFDEYQTRAAVCESDLELYKNAREGNIHDTSMLLYLKQIVTELPPTS